MSPIFCFFIFFPAASSTLLNFDVSPFLSLFNGTTLQIIGFMNMYNNNTIERLDSYMVPPSFDSTAGVNSKDVVVLPESGVAARLFVPINPALPQGRKFPLVIYLHGGGFVTGSAFSPAYHNYVNSLAANASVVALSVNYKICPENPVPVPYLDSWSVVKWVAKHSKGLGNEAWLNDYVDFEKVYLAGDSAGANIAHNVAMLAGLEGLDGFKIAGMVLMSPYFWGTQPIGEHEPKDTILRNTIQTLWYVATGMKIGVDHPWLNPILDPNLSKLGCTRVLVCISERDWLRDRGEYYSMALGGSGWKGEVELYETKGENHVFQLTKPNTPNSQALLNEVSSFINK
ncbi:probable carboxylesterase 7 [Cornus florida]|uniref:probable carboxylesterase 7 n=1 Tax=Cornus florida TaxID=4283 RepID=UPI00289A1064|nr:probable carboxylesterase 7 [Cornus florida]